MPGLDILIWPAVVIICAIVVGIPALFIFRAPISQLMGRISKAGKDGVSFERPQEGRSENKPSALPFPELMKAPISATVLAREDYLKNQLQEFNLQNDTEKISVLIRVAATSRIEAEFNNISHIIFGSQLDLLILISGTPDGITIQQANDFFKAVQETSPDIHGNRKFEEWFHYLLGSGLTTQTEKIDITQYGKDFLKYLVDARLAYRRNG